MAGFQNDNFNNASMNASMRCWPSLQLFGKDQIDHYHTPVTRNCPMLRLCGVGQNDQNHIVVTLFPWSVTAIQVWAKSPRLQSCNSRADLPFSLHELPAPFRRRCPARSFRRSWPGIPCRRSFGSQSANRATEPKNRYTNRPEKTLPFWEASSSVLCSDSICSKTAPIALNALRIELKYL